AGALFPLFFSDAFVSAFFAFSADFVGLDCVFAGGLGEALANTVFLGVGFGVCVGFGVGVAGSFGLDVGVGVAVGNSISLFGAAKRGFSFSASSVFGRVGWGEGESFADDGSPVVGSVFALAPPTSPNQTMLWAFGALLASTLQRINPAISATCASAISVTFRQKRPSLDIAISTLSSSFRPSLRCRPS